MDFVIIAAGQGSRIMNECGYEKPIVPIDGVPMVERLVRVLFSVGADRVHIVTNPAMTKTNVLLKHLRDEECMAIDFRPIVSDNSFYSLEEAARGVKGRFVAFTVDTIFKTSDLAMFVRKFESLPDGEVLMGVTSFVDDESPLWYRLSDDGGEALECRKGGEAYGGAPVVSAGIYGISDKAMDMACGERYPESTSDFQDILARSSEVHVRPFFFDNAFDVDHEADIAKANEFIGR